LPKSNVLITILWKTALPKLNIIAGKYHFQRQNRIFYINIVWFKALLKQKVLNQSRRSIALPKPNIQYQCLIVKSIAIIESNGQYYRQINDYIPIVLTKALPKPNVQYQYVRSASILYRQISLPNASKMYHFCMDNMISKNRMFYITIV
jgi:hypothetical protein